MKIVGILGGFGPETTAEFYNLIVNKNRELKRLNHPNILIHNAPVPFEVEEDVVKNARNEHKLLPLLINGVVTLHDKVDFIVIPCNTVHIFIDELRKKSKVPIVSIIEEVTSEIKNICLKKVGVLATSKSIQSKLFESKFVKAGIEQIKPNENDQKRLSEIISLILNGKKSDNMKIELLGIVEDLTKQGSEGIVLGCTDLQLLLSQKDCPVRLIDTTEVLVNSTVKMIDGTTM